LVFLETSRGVQVMHDMVGPTGPQIQYGMINAESGWIAISDRIADGWLHSVDRAPSGDEAVMIHTSSQGWVIRAMIDDSMSSRDDIDILEQLRYSLGLDENSFNILLGGVAIAVLLLCTIVLGVLSGRAIRWMGGGRRVRAEGTLLLEEDVVEVIDDDDIPVTVVDTSSIVELVETGPESDAGGQRRQRRERRAAVADATEIRALPSMPQSPESAAVPAELPPLDEGMPMPPGMPMLNRPVMCPECSSRFEVAADLTMTRCPICALRIDF
jgi:hypothetical protein